MFTCKATNLSIHRLTMKEVKFYFEDERTYTTIASYIDCLDNFNNQLIYDYNTTVDEDEDEFQIYLYADENIIDAVYTQIKMLEMLTKLEELK